MWVRGEARLVKDERGRPLFLQGVAFDITESKRAEEILVAHAVRSTEERYRDVVETSGAIFWEANVETLRFEFVSRQAEKILGFPRGRWLEDPQFWIMSVHPEDRGRVAAEWQTFVDAEAADRDLEYRALTASGDVVWLHNRIHVARGQQGQSRHLLGFIVDITDRKRSEQELGRLLALEQEARDEAETLHDLGRRLAAELDTEPLVQAVTDAGTTLTGAGFGAFFYNVTDERGESYMLFALSGVPRDRFKDFPLPRNTPLFEATFRGAGIVRLDDVRTDSRYGRMPPHHGTPPGHLPVRSYLAVPVVSRSGEVLGGLFFGHPEVARFSERHERIIAGLTAQAAIAMDNARLYKAAQVAREAAETASRTKDEFLATLSHELRTPLTAILGWARMLRTRDADAAERARAMEIIERNATAQAQLIEDLLDVSRIVAGKLQLTMRPLENVAPLVNGVVESFRPTAQAKHITLRAILDQRAGPIAGDRDRLQQVVWNLVSNAVKFTPAGGRVDVRCERTNGEVEIGVTDTGKGRRSCRTSSTASARPMRRAHALTAASAWACRSSAIWSSCTAAPSAPRARAKARARPSRCACPWPARRWRARRPPCPRVRARRPSPRPTRRCRNCACCSSKTTRTRGRCSACCWSATAPRCSRWRARSTAWSATSACRASTVTT